MFETDTDISMCVNMLDELTSAKHANGVGRGFGKALVYFAVQILRRDVGRNTKGLIARTESNYNFYNYNVVNELYFFELKL